MKTAAMIGVGKLGQECAEVMALHYDMVGYDVIPRNPAFYMMPSIQEAVQGRDFIFIAAPTAHDPIYGGETPTSHLPNKDFDYTIVTDILTEVNKYVTKDQLVVLISTVLPGTVRNILEPCITNARFIYNPYLIAMGTTKWDMVNPEMVIIGTESGEVTGDAQELIDFYKVFMENDPRYEVGTWDEAESIKIFYNTFISTKVALVNMVLDVAETNGNINVDVVTRALAKSTHRITGPSYMVAGMGDGGACHPRDNIALRFLADRLDLGYDLFDAIMKAREVQAERMAKRCLANGTNVTIIGKAYKPAVPYTNGSASMLVGHYIEKMGGHVNYYDANTGDRDFRQDWTHVYLIGYWEDYVKESLVNVPINAVIIDPWRKGISLPGVFRPAVINYGDSRPAEPFQTTEEQQQSVQTLLDIIPEVTDRIESLLLITQREYLYHPAETLVGNIRSAFDSGKTDVIFSCPSESLLTADIRKLHVVIDLLPEIDTTHFFLVTGAHNGGEVYKNISSLFWSDKIRLNIVSVQLFEQLARGYLSKMLFSPNSSVADRLSADAEYKIAVRPKKLLCFNKIPRGHRVYLTARLLANGLLDKSYYSFEGQPNWLDSPYGEPHISWDNSMNEVISNNKHRFPIRLNLTADRNNPIDSVHADREYYTNSYFSVVNETIFYKKDLKRGLTSNYEDAIFLSEKIFKPIISKHPFILVGVSTSLSVLHEMGYRTFHPFINESYDLEEDDDNRLDMIVKEIERLCAFTDDQWLEWQHQIKCIVEHNFSVIQTRTVNNPDVFTTGLVQKKGK